MQNAVTCADLGKQYGKYQQYEMRKMDAKHGSAESNVASNDNNTEIGMLSSENVAFVKTCSTF